MNSALAFEIGDLDKDEIEQITHKVVVREDEDGEPVSGFIIVGKNSPQFQEVSNLLRKDNIKRSAKRKTQIDSSTDDGAEIVAKTIANNEKAIALAVVVNWFGFNLEGQPIDFDKNTVAKMFAKYPQWQLRVNNALDNDGNFMKV